MAENETESSQNCCQRMGQFLSGMWGDNEAENRSITGPDPNDKDRGSGRDPLIKRSIPEGSMVYMQKQDPSVDDIGYRPVWVGLDIKYGPRCDYIQIKGMRTVYPSDTRNNYLYSPYMKPDEFDAVNAFAVVNHVRTMYKRALLRIDSDKKVEWNWGSYTPIKVYPRAGDWANAFYSRDEKSLAFFYFKDEKTGDMVYTCRSFDIMAHECGHAILDALKPNYITSKNPQTGALHEAFGDLTAIFALLELLDICEAIIAYSKCDLHSHGWFAVIGEQFGTALGLNLGLRNADNNLKLDEVTEEVHDLSKVFTGAVFDSLVEIFELTRNIEKYDPAETLYRTGKHLASTTIGGFLNGPSTNASFRDIADSMMAAELVPEYREIMRFHFEKRKIYDWRASPRPITAAAAPAHIICGTMQLHGASPTRDNLRDRLAKSLIASDEAYPYQPEPETNRDRTDGRTDIIPLVATEEIKPVNGSSAPQPEIHVTAPFPVEDQGEIVQIASL